LNTTFGKQGHFLRNDLAWPHPKSISDVCLASAIGKSPHHAPEPVAYLIFDWAGTLYSLNPRLIPYVAVDEVVFYGIATKMLHCDFNAVAPVILNHNLGNLSKS